MKTKLLDPSKIGLSELVKTCKEIFDAGELLAFPTETVYGLGGNGLSPVSAKKIYEAKGRPSDNPLILHIGKREDLSGIAASVSEKAEKLMDAFWPGPLTMIFEKTENVPPETTGGLSTVAVRMPKDKIAMAILKALPYPIAAPSANRSGRPSCTKAEHVIEDLRGRIAAIIDADPSEIGLESTIIDMTAEPPVLLRPGQISKNDIEKIIGAIDVDPAILRSSILSHRQVAVPKAPGMKYRHYAPKAEMAVVGGETEREMIEKIRSLSDGETGILTVSEHRDDYREGVVLFLGKKDDPSELAKNLFDRLRAFDAMGVKKIYAEDLSLYGVGEAVMNRLLKSAGGIMIS